MLSNNNKAVITKLYRKMLKQNRLRNFVSLTAIVLTTFMFTSIFTFGFSLTANLNRMLLRQQGTCASVYLNAPTQEQIENIKKNHLVKAAGIQIKAGTLSVENNSYGMFYYDETEFEQNFAPAIENMEGRYPELANEIMLPTSLLQSLGVMEPKQNQQLELCVNDEMEQLTLSGWYDGFAFSNPALVSEQYVTQKGRTVYDS